MQPALQRNAPVTTPDDSQRPVRLLIFEDDPEFRAVLVEFFGEEGFEVITCASYAHLREAVRSTDRQIVLADFWGASHLELSEVEQNEIRAVARRAPTILVSGRAWTATVSPEDLGVVCIVSKPLVLDALLQQVLGCPLG
jgi:DNA-binding NtrC family response regulator